jgi:hypothetical protein
MTMVKAIWGSEDIFASAMDYCEAMACAAMLTIKAEVTGVGGGLRRWWAATTRWHG